MAYSFGHLVCSAAKAQSQWAIEESDLRKRLPTKKKKKKKKKKKRKKEKEKEKSGNDLCTFQNLKQKSKENGTVLSFDSCRVHSVWLLYLCFHFLYRFIENRIM